MNNFVLHLRLIKSCNASCDYCSAFEEKHDTLMKIEDFKKSILFLKQYLKTKNIQCLDIEYVGGEILLIEKETIKEMVSFVREELQSVCTELKDGCQSNLIGSKQKVSFLNDLFEGRVGTSVDKFSGQRKVGSSSENYQKVFWMRHQELKKVNFNGPGAVFVLDNKTKNYLIDELEIANQKNYALTIRTLFQGGAKIDNTLSFDMVEELYLQAFNEWFLRKRVVVQPFYQMLNRRMAEVYKNEKYENNNSGCHFQHNCIDKSLSLEPNGDLYLCQEMGDGSNLKIGNALSQTINTTIVDILGKRSQKIHSDCIVCPYFKSCQGGCMKEAIDHHQDLYEKTLMCSTWKKLFARMDELLTSTPKDKVLSWLKYLEK